ncbi:tyrosine-protein phosphatase [Streptosporangium sp. KLBMP 9127]|nr:tyrosine-protein phosphatase [Streptosporangium sp. KLBMP 9127]
MNRWIELEGAVNVRDLGGLATLDGGETKFGRIIRSDNLQELTPGDVARVVGELKLRHVVDLRSGREVTLEGPGPLTAVPEMTIHHHTLFAEGGTRTDTDAVDVNPVLPWHERHGDADRRVTGLYYTYLRERPDSVVSALRAMASEDGGAIVHCAAGKDRTSVLCALALEIAGADRAAIIEDYLATADRLERILTRLRRSDTYRADLDPRSASEHLPRAQYIERFFNVLDARDGGVLRWLAQHGWTGSDTEAIRAKLLD